MINIAKIVKCYFFPIVLRNLPDILSFIEGQMLRSNVEILLPQ